MDWKTKFVEKLSEDFEALKAKDPKFSLRQYAKKIKVSPTALSELFRGVQRWQLSPERAREIVDVMNLSDETKSWLKALMGFSPDLKRHTIENRDFDILLKPAYIPVACCFDLPEDQTTTEKIAGRLGLKPEVVSSIIEDLKALGHLKENLETKKISRTPVSWGAGDGPPNEVITNFHKISTQFAADSIEHVPSDERHYSSMTFTGSRDQIAVMRQEMQNFSERIKHLLKTGNPSDEVFRFSVCLFPIRNIPTTTGQEIP